METIKRDLDAIIEYLEGLDDDSLIEIHNEYCSQYDMDNYIWSNDEHFFTEMFDGRIDEAVRAVCYGEYHYTDNYVWFNGYANLESGNYTNNMPIDINEIADDILENEGNYYDIELEDEEDEDE